MTTYKKIIILNSSFLILNSFYPFNPPLETPFTMYFLAKTNKIIIGITITLDAAIKSSWREPASVVKAWSP